MKLIAFIIAWTMLVLSTEAQTVDLPGGVRQEHVMIPMRDGTRLSCYLYFPSGEGPWPALYQQRYATVTSKSTQESLARLAKGGYVVAAQNFRGTQLSEGRYVGYRALGWGEQRDGYDTVEWLAQQRWCNGKVGTFGGSQAGFAQNFLAVTQPPHLVCQYMIDTGLSLFQEGYRIGGVTRPKRFERMADVCRDKSHNRLLLEEWYQHPHYDDYWKAEDCSLHFDKMNVPCMTIGSWYDFMNVGSIQSYIGRETQGGPNSRGQQRLVIGPWLHGGFNKPNKVGELEYPTNAALNLEAHMLEWFDHQLKGVDNAAKDERPIRYYMMGALDDPHAPGNWWQVAYGMWNWEDGRVNRPYYLRESGLLSTSPPTEGSSSTTWKADPTKPAEIPGVGFPGARDARPFEQQPNVITFTTEPLAQPVEWLGKVEADLVVSSSARDTDVIVRVSDVYPDGRSILIIDMIRRLRYREGFDREVLLEPGKAYRVKFDVGWIGQIFNTGHRIRVTIASTGEPFYESNPNTGEPLTIDPPTKTVVAENEVIHNLREASRIIAPQRRP